MTVGILGKRYASALLQLAIESKSVDRIGRNLADFGETWKHSPELQSVFENPEFGADDRKKIINEIATRTGMNILVKNMLLLLSDRRRMRYVLEIIDAFEALSEERSGKVRADVISASDLPETFYTNLKKTLQSVTGKDITIVKSKDPSLIGGVITKIGDQVFDGSIRNRLTELRDELRSQTITPSAEPE